MPAEMPWTSSIPACTLSPMTTDSSRNLILILVAATALAFILTLVGADAGASEAIIVKALCAVAVLGAMAFTVIMTGLRSQ